MSGGVGAEGSIPSATRLAFWCFLPKGSISSAVNNYVIAIRILHLKGLTNPVVNRLADNACPFALQLNISRLDIIHSKRDYAASLTASDLGAGILRECHVATVELGPPTFDLLSINLLSQTKGFPIKLSCLRQVSYFKQHEISSTDSHITG
jgi:hypothetical protein